jgi:hypothetical protein
MLRAMPKPTCDHEAVSQPADGLRWEKLCRCVVAFSLLSLIAACGAPVAPAGEPAAASAGEAAAAPEAASIGLELPRGVEPQLCNPENPVLTPLSQYERGEAQPVLVDGGTALVVIYENEQGQTFTITVEGIDVEFLQAYLDTVSVCYEALEDSDLRIPERPLVSLREAVLAAIGQYMGGSGSEVWEQFSTAYAAGLYGAISDMLDASDIDPDAVFEGALGILEDSGKAAVEAGLATDGDLEAQIFSVIDEVGARGGAREFLNSLLDPETEQALNLVDDLTSNGDHIAVTVEWQDSRQAEVPYVVFFAIDPCQPPNASRIWYPFIQARSVNSIIWVSRGNERLTLWYWAHPYVYRIDNDLRGSGVWTRRLYGYWWHVSNTVQPQWFITSVDQSGEGADCFVMSGSWRLYDPLP